MPGTLEMVILAMIEVYLLFFLSLETEIFFFFFWAHCSLEQKIFSSLSCN